MDTRCEASGEVCLIHPDHAGGEQVCHHYRLVVVGPLPVCSPPLGEIKSKPKFMLFILRIELEDAAIYFGEEIVILLCIDTDPIARCYEDACDSFLRPKGFVGYNRIAQVGAVNADIGFLTLVSYSN